MRFDKVTALDVSSFICGNSACANCCIKEVFGRCVVITDTWNSGDKGREKLLRAMRLRIERGERTMERANKIGIYFDAKVV